MKNNKSAHNKIYALIAMLLLLGISFVSAFSVSSPYMANKELNVFPDSKTTDLEFVLQNGGGATENVSVRVLVLEGSEVAKILDNSNIYVVVPGDKVPVNLRVTLPDDVMIGNVYNIKLEFTTVSSGQSGEFGFGTGQEQSFKVVIVKEVVPEENINSTYSKVLLYLIIGILLLILIIAMFLFRKKKRRPFKK
jgi:hypothetical protein